MAAPALLSSWVDMQLPGGWIEKHHCAYDFAFPFLGLAVVPQGQAEEYYIYQGPNGELVISLQPEPTFGALSLLLMYFSA